MSVVRRPCFGRRLAFTEIVREHGIARRERERFGRRVIERQGDMNTGIELRMRGDRLRNTVQRIDLGNRSLSLAGQ